jgi:TetR/AcrR family transcriptional regulator, fatty acid metabolism regulator protein
VTRSPHVQREIEEITQAMQALEGIIRRGQEAGEFNPDLDPRLGAVVFYGALDEILTGWVLGQLPDKDEDIATAERNVVSLLVGGLAAGKAPA